LYLKPLKEKLDGIFELIYEDNSIKKLLFIAKVNMQSCSDVMIIV